MLHITFRASALLLVSALLLTSSARGQAGGDPPRPFVEATNAVYGVSINESGGTDRTDPVAGYFTAWTEAFHPVRREIDAFGFLCDYSARRHVFEGGSSAFTNAAIRSYSSATDYPLGSNPGFIQEPAPGFACTPTNEWTLPLVEQVLIGGEPRGVRAAWTIVSGTDDFDVELLLAARGDDMMDSAIELSVTLRNHGTEPLALGLRHVLALRRSDATGFAVLMRYFGLREPGEPTEPLSSVERAWSPPTARAWESWSSADSATPYTIPGSETYAIAGAMSGPESLIPPPTAPDLLQFTHVNTFGTTTTPGLADACFAWDVPDPPRAITHNQTAVALTWGHDEDHALVLDPGGEVTLTQYLMAFITYPLETATFGPWEQDCEGPVTAVPVQAQAQPLYDTDAEIFHEWSSSDPRVSFADTSAAETTALVEGTGTFPVHHRTWVGPWEAHADDEILIVDSEPPNFETLSVSPASLWPPNHRLEEVSVEWTVTDNCDADPTVRLVSVTSNEPERRLPGWGAGNTEQDIVGADLGEPDTELQLRAERAGVGGGRTYTLTYEAEDATGNLTTETVQVRVAHDRRSRRPRRSR